MKKCKVYSSIGKKKLDIIANYAEYVIVQKRIIL